MGPVSSARRRGRRGLRLRCTAESESGVGGLPPAGMDWGGTSSRGQETQGDCAENQTWNKNQVVPPPTLLLQWGGGAGGEGGDIRFSRKADSRPAGSCVGSRDLDAGQLRGVAGARRGGPRPADLYERKPQVVWAVMSRVPRFASGWISGPQIMCAGRRRAHFGSILNPLWMSVRVCTRMCT